MFTEFEICSEILKYDTFLVQGFGSQVSSKHTRIALHADRMRLRIAARGAGCQ